jgi:carboxyl-terminal processing protease
MSDPLWRKVFKKNWLFLLLQAAIVFLAIALGYLGHWAINKNQGDLNLLQEARKILVENTIYEIPGDTDLEYGMIRGMLGTLDDPYTYFVEPAQAEVQSNELAGSFGGIGVRLERDLDSQWRIYPLPDSPAKQAGLRDGDRLLSVGELRVTNEIDDVSIIAHLRGPINETVEIEIQRSGEKLSFTIERQTISLPSVSWNILPDAETIGLVQINRIAETTTDEIVAGIDALKASGAESIILDLRDNGGGLVETGIDISELFLTDGEIIHRQFKNEEVEIFSVEKSGEFSEIPLVIWMNGYTASAAEIIAGALSNHDRTTLIGSPSYGKTTIQYIFPLQDESSLHVTSGRWWIPGVTFPLLPDISLSEDSNEIHYLEKSIEVLQD